LRGPGTVVFEGAQGVLLDQDFGFHPHTTWSNCTFNNALDLIGDADVEVTRLGLVRSFQTKHGAGPFVTEYPSMSDLVKKDHNKLDDWQGAFRVGFLDLVATRYAIEACGSIDGLVVTWADARVRHICSHYKDDNDYVFHTLTLPHTLSEQEALGKKLSSMTPHVVGVYGHGPTAVAGTLGVPLALASYGPTVLDKTSYNGIV
jgi:adenylosuccinate synthase